MPQTTPPPLRTAWFIWGLGALFYLIAFFQRVAPAVMTEELMRDFGISAAALGNLSAFYFYSYVAMQIPTGIMADAWGPRRLMAAGAFVAGIGTLLFALSVDFFWACLGRFLIGGSVAVAFVALLKVATSWFPPRFFAMVSGMALPFGIAGAVIAGAPLRLIMNHQSWRSVMLAAAVFTFAMAVVIWIYVRDFPREKGYTDLSPHRTVGKHVIRGIVDVFKYRNVILLFVIPGAMVGGVLTFSGLWGVPFLTTHYGMPTARAAALTSLLLAASAVGGPIFGWLSDKLGRRKPLYIMGFAVTLLGWMALFYLPKLSFLLLVAVLGVTGFSSGSMIISFAFAKESIPPHLSGTVSGVINMGIMAGPMLLQPMVGWMLDARWKGTMAAGVRTYDLDAYQTGFSLLIAWIAVALVLLFFTRETRCKQLTSVPKQK